MIRNKDDLAILANKMKACQCPDDTQYTAQDPNARDVIERMSEAELQLLRESDANRAIIWQKNIYTLCCTQNALNDDKWHLSMCKVVGSGELGRMSDEETTFILDGFFGTYQEVQSPSKMPAVRHFTGND